MVKINPYSNIPWPLYSYFLRTYSNFFLSGKCLDFPRVIQLQTQSRCNGRCEMCPYRITSKEFEHGVMEKSLLAKISDEIMEMGKSPMLMFALHNEPLLEKRIFQQVAYIKSNNPNCYCILPTNGQLLETFSLDQIKESKIDQLNINLGAFSKETYERIYTGFDYYKLKNNLSTLIADESLKNKLQIMFVLNEENIQEAQKASRYWKEQAVHIKVVPLQNRAGSLDNYEKLRIKRNSYPGGPLLAGWKYFTYRARHSLGCELPFYQMNILYNGDVILCSCDWKRTTIIGNLKNSSIKSIWNSERLNSIRKIILKKRYDQIPACKNCSMVH
jgi:radical SAM protein with 4Fe4S-binding SPASM domain